ncbi:cytochrome c oxidase subunit 3 [Neorhizobium sp. T786]|uniref:cytochrome c oxidase subunit 3 n=1 Tax=Pseudorhizobium xiangyangii TaxID=2883104 RepID=UPI001CFFD4D1|nr:cytochrome c oxidase subunit 3 [Neorhizobium xiangyangii]MCB5204647.1 cytochrome c oxidase subunit 3 [Neorhizobium xiangyangii]
MNVMLLFLAVLGAIILWWMAGQRLTSKPWLEASAIQVAATGSRDVPGLAAKVGLYVFLGVVGALFSLFISAYSMRMGAGDWGAMPIPTVLWFNTVVLVAVSAVLQWARIEAEDGRMEILRPMLALGFTLACLFLVGQLQAWRSLIADGYVLADNPANSFFYMLTGFHGLHILGGLVVIGRTTVRAFANDIPSARLRLSVSLCSIYFHFMLAVWLILFALFAGWANDVVDLCRQLFS